MKKALVSSIATVLLLIPFPSANAEPTTVTCKMSGVVEVKPGLRAPGPGYYGDEYKVKIEGELIDCRGSQNVPGSAVLKARGKGEGTCVLRSLQGVASLKWDNGNHTTFDFTTKDLASANAFTTAVTKSNDPAMQEGDSGLGALRFTGDTSKCNTPEGVTSATFEGQLTSGSTS